MSIVASLATADPLLASVSSLTTLWVLPTLVAGLAGGWFSAVLAHRYEVGEDDDGYEIAVFGGRLAAGPKPASFWVHIAASVVGSLAMLATWGPHLVVVPFVWLVFVLVTAATTDHRTMLIPKRVVWVGFGVGLALIAVVSVAWGRPELLTSALVGAAAYFGFLFVTHLINPGGMGFGDVRLALVLGLYLGWIDIRLPLFGLLLANIAYLAYAVPQRIRRGKEHGRFSPFGPGLAIGTLAAVCLQSVLV